MPTKTTRKTPTRKSNVARPKSKSALNSKFTFSRSQLAIVIGLILVIGGIIVWRVLAATSQTEVETWPASGGNTKTVTDNTASGGSYLEFLTPTVSTTVTPTPTSPGGLPTVSSTGWQHTGVSLASCEQYSNGTDYIISGTASGRVVDGCDFTGKQVRITGGGAVTLKRSRVRNADNCDTACAAIYVANGAGPVTIEDVEVTTTNPNVTNEAQRQDRTIGVDKNNSQPVMLRRVYAHDTTRGVDITGQQNITFEDSYLGFNVSPPSNGDCGQERKHSTAVRAAGGVSNVLFKNTVLGVGNCAFASGLVAFYPENGPNHDIVFDGGLWIIQGNNDGAYGIAVGWTLAEDENYNFTVKNVQISTQYYAEGCPEGCGQNWNGSNWNPDIFGPKGVKIWQNVTKYNPGKADHGQPIGP